MWCTGPGYRPRKAPRPGKRSATGGGMPAPSPDDTNAKKPSLSTGLSALFDARQFPTLTWGDPTLPSALRRFTSEFGMGSGGTTALVPPPANSVLSTRPADASTNLYQLKIFSNPPKHLRRCKVKPHGSLVPVSSTHRCAYTPGLSTSSSLTFLQET